MGSEWDLRRFSEFHFSASSVWTLVKWPNALLESFLQWQWGIYIQWGTYMQIHPLCRIGSNCVISESCT